MQVSVIQANPQGPEALALLREAAVEAQQLYPELHDPNAPWPTNPPTPSRGVYVVAFAEAQAVGMGAHRPLDEETTEVRRMYVSRSARRHGIARAILRHLEAHAQEQGFSRLVLETGNRQVPAMKLYESFGFRRTVPFGSYRDDPTSVCYEKTVTSPPQGEA